MKRLLPLIFCILLSPSIAAAGCHGSAQFAAPCLMCVPHHLASLLLFQKTLISPILAVASPEAPDTHPLTPGQQQTRSQIYTALRIGAAATTVGLLSLIAFLLRRERRARRKEAAP